MLTIKNGRTGTIWVLPTAVVVGMMLLSACGAQATPQTITDPTAASPAQESTQPTGAASPTAAAPATATTAPEATEQSEAPGDVLISFKTDVLPILESRCIKCHGGDKTEAKLNLTSYKGLMAGAEKGVVVVASDAAKSKLIQLTQSGKMPKRSAKLLPDQLQILVDWVNQGAQDN